MKEEQTFFEQLFETAYYRFMQDIATDENVAMNYEPEYSISATKLG